MSDGTCQLVGGHWHVEAKPHVAMWARRLFDGSRYGRNVLMMKDTPRACVDLRWFMARFPLTMSDADRARLDGRADAHLASQQTVRNVLDGYEAPPNFPLAEPARGYQQTAAAAFLAARRGLLADDVGLGKTVTAICPMAVGLLPALVVTPTHLTRQWQAMLARFAPPLTTHIIKKGTPYPLTVGQRRLDGGELPDVLIINYAKLGGWGYELAGRIRYVVFDECQDLRHGTVTNKGRAAGDIAAEAEYVWGLSATPIYNMGEEFFNLFSILAPHVLGARTEFGATWCDNGMKKVVDPLAFGSFLRDEGVMIRRTRKEVGRELPPVTIVPHTIDADARVLRDMEGRAAELARIVLAKSESHSGAKMMAGGELSVLLRQQTGVAKAPFVADFVRLLVESGEKVVLYGWHYEVYDIWAERLKDLNPVFYTGRESVPQKEAAKRAFVEGESQVMVISLRAGSGLDGLQFVCRTVVFGEPDWSDSVHTQDIGRVYRDGQTDPVMAYYLLADSGSDPIIADILGIKAAQLKPVLDPDGGEEIAVDESRVTRLAAAYLEQIGQALPEPDELSDAGNIREPGPWPPPTAPWSGADDDADADEEQLTFGLWP